MSCFSLIILYMKNGSSSFKSSLKCDLVKRLKSFYYRKKHVRCNIKNCLKNHAQMLKQCVFSHRISVKDWSLIRYLLLVSLLEIAILKIFIEMMRDSFVYFPMMHMREENFFRKKIKRRC